MSNCLGDKRKRVATDIQPQPICVWASISMWCLLLGLALLFMGIGLSVYDKYRWVVFITKCLAFCSSPLILFSPVSGIVALVVIKKSRGQLKGAARAGTYLVLSSILIGLSFGLALLNTVKRRHGKILAPFQDGDIVKAQELLTKKPHVANKRLIWGYTPMHAAASMGHCAVVELLILNGAKVDILSRSGDTPLHQAASAGCVEVVELLLKNGANIEAKDASGKTPLHRAASAYKNGKEIVRLLLSKGADPTVEDEYGQNPLDIAEVWNLEDIAELLRTWNGTLQSSVN